MPDVFARVLEFENQEPPFAMGFECGRIWAILHLVGAPFECEMHLANAEMILRMAEARERTVSWEELDETWATVSFGGQDGTSPD